MTLLDTHVLIWHESGDGRLGPRARRAFAQALEQGEAAVSAISFWEVGMRVRKGRLDLLLDPEAWRRDLIGHGLIEIPIDGAIASRAGLLAKMHGDPADRIIVATALEGHRLMTADRQMLEWPGPLRCVSARD
ncbi:MAG: type II toxin-antitoxin system VapC family toxin [Acidobacteria bacterium]|nr:type II toxin-antitoxin system VapC family toxin [Acidobacteriota bacterium]